MAGANNDHPVWSSGNATNLLPHVDRVNEALSVKSRIRTVWSWLPVTAIGRSLTWLTATELTESVWRARGTPGASG